MGHVAEPKEDILVMFSGGKDSFLSAAMLLSDGHDAVLASFQNGALACPENLLHGIKRLQAAYGESRVRYAGLLPIAGTMRDAGTWWETTPARDRCRDGAPLYPDLTACQERCLRCQASMWASAIAYAKTKNIKRIACGYKDTDVFCTGCGWFRAAMRCMAAGHGISIEFPVLDVTDGFDRDSRLMRHGFEPQVLEPKCMLGRPPRDGTLTGAESLDMEAYFSEQLEPAMGRAVERLVPVYRYASFGPGTWR